MTRVDWFARTAVEAEKARDAEKDRAPAITVRRDHVFADMPVAEQRQLLLLSGLTGLPLKIVTRRTAAEPTP